MTDRLVTLTVWILAAGFALACVAFGWRASLQPPATATAAVAGASAWQDHCARCHAASEFTGRLAAPDRATAAGRWLAHLERHGDAPFADDAAILHWLALQAAAAESADPDAPVEPEDGDEFSL